MAREKTQELPAAMSALSLVILGLLMAVPPASCQQGSTGRGQPGWCHEERAGLGAGNPWG